MKLKHIPVYQLTYIRDIMVNNYKYVTIVGNRVHTNGYPDIYDRTVGLPVYIPVYRTGHTLSDRYNDLRVGLRRTIVRSYDRIRSYNTGRRSYDVQY